MQLSRTVIQSLDLASAAEAVTEDGLQRFPQLAVYTCLQHCISELVAHAATTAQNGRAVVAEVLTMPRKKFGSRPVLMLSPVDFTLYNALVGRLLPVLGEASRGEEKFGTFRRFGVPDEGDKRTAAHHIVSTDIAAFYEYVGHEHLKSELSLRSAGVDLLDGLLAFLNSAYGEPRGLPQLIEASDRLADAYLGPMDRALMRTGWPMVRFADDFKVQVDDWATALGIIEEATHAAREIGLVLSTEKTVVTKAETLRARRDRDREFLFEHFAVARDQLRADRFLGRPYGPDESVDPGASEGLREALQRILNEWLAEPDGKPLNVNYLTSALRILRDSPERIDDSVLPEIVFRHPVDLEYACKYLVARHGESVENWRALAKLIKMERRSPWAILWLLNAFGEMEEGVGGSDEEEVAGWAYRQLSHRAEVVRAEAAWQLATKNSLQTSDIARLYGSATLLSRPSLAASAGRIAARAGSSQELRAIESENVLTKAAAAWGKSGHESA